MNETEQPEHKLILRALTRADYPHIKRIMDLDLDLLKELRQQGSVRNLQSRRKELYEVVWKSAAHENG